MLRPSATLNRYLERAPSVVLNVYAMTAAFCTYFCMYGFRKPFAAGTYEGLSFFGTQIDLKTAFVISQIIGYALSKYLGIKFCPEITRRRRGWLLVALVMLAELALVLFAIVPPNLKVAAIFLNGMPLGMVWGLVVWYLEGRRTSEILMAVLSCSFIVASGVVKDIGRSLMSGANLLGASWLPALPEVSEFWMPAATGLLFVLPFLISAWLLDRLPEPTKADVADRSLRETMTIEDRKNFIRRYFPGLAMLVITYVALTAFRDFRDNYTVDVINDLGLQDKNDAISQMETRIAFCVLFVMGMLFFVKDNRQAMLGIFAVVGGGMLMMGISTWMLDQGTLDGYRWMMLIGLGSYLGYVPYNSVLFDRLMASTRAVGTAVFAIYVADALGYTGSVFIQIFNDVAVGDMSRLEFLKGLSYLVSVSGVVLTTGSVWYFLRKSPAVEDSLAPVVAELDINQ